MQIPFEYYKTFNKDTKVYLKAKWNTRKSYRLVTHPQFFSPQIAFFFPQSRHTNFFSWDNSNMVSPLINTLFRQITRIQPLPTGAIYSTHILGYSGILQSSSDFCSLHSSAATKILLEYKPDNVAPLVTHLEIKPRSFTRSISSGPWLFCWLCSYHSAPCLLKQERQASVSGP